LYLTLFFIELKILSKYARIPPSSAGGMNGFPTPRGERVRVRGKRCNHHPHLNSPPCLRRSGYAQAGIKGEESFLEN